MKANVLLIIALLAATQARAADPPCSDSWTQLFDRKLGGGSTIADIAPLSDLGGGAYLLELFHGPTFAFKDVALQILGRLFAIALKKRGGRATIVAAATALFLAGPAQAQAQTPTPATAIVMASTTSTAAARSRRAPQGRARAHSGARRDLAR